MVVREQPRNSNAIVPYRPQREVVISENKNNTVVEVKSGNSVSNGKHTTKKHTVKNQRKKDYSRLAKYVKASDAGNRYLM